MKAILAFLTVFALAVIIACGGSGGGGVFTTDDTGGVYHDAIDNDPAAAPSVREEALIKVTKQLVVRLIPEPNDSLSYDVVDEDPVVGAAIVKITGLFIEDGEWFEKEASINIARTASGSWVLENEPAFDLTEKGQAKKDELEAQAQREARRKESIEVLSELLQIFDEVEVKIISTQISQDPANPQIGTIHISGQIKNPTDRELEVLYTLGWKEDSPTSPQPECVKRALESFYNRIGAAGKKVSPHSTLDFQIDLNVNYSGEICKEAIVENLRSEILLFGYSREEAQKRLSELQTSP